MGGAAGPPVKAAAAPAPPRRAAAGPAIPGTDPISSLQWRARARVGGKIKTLRVQTSTAVPTLECVLVDASGEAITLVFLGRRSIAGFHSGTRLVAEGRVAKHRGKLAMMNPVYEILSVAAQAGTDGHGT
jgi:hypothetical protein